MINLAPIKYLNLPSLKFPFEEIIHYKIKLLNQEENFETAVRLCKKLKNSEIHVSKIYSNYDGAGASRFKNHSLYKAISEGIERWAFYESSEGELEKKYGFDVNPSTCGMSSLPELFPFWVRKLAKEEAVERFSIHAFNRKNLPVQELPSKIENLRIFRILNNINDCEVVMLSYFNGKFYVYAFSCKKTIENCLAHAFVELARNERVLTRFYENPISMNNLELSDKRLVFFSTEDGNLEFLEKIKSCPKSIKETPKLILDKEIKGPWSKYAITWRYLFADSYDLESSDLKYFMF